LHVIVDTFQKKRAPHLIYPKGGFMRGNGGGNPLDRLALRPLSGRPGQMMLLSPGDISFAFLGAAAPAELMAISIQNGWCLEPRRVYVRTSRGIYWTPYRRLALLQSELNARESSQFLRIGRTCLVNTLKIAALDTGGRIPLLVFAAVDGSREILTVSRRAWPALRDRLGLPRRRVVRKPAGSARRAVRDAAEAARRGSDGKVQGNLVNSSRKERPQ
jgi:LytTr DNA-binding domain